MKIYDCEGNEIHDDNEWGIQISHRHTGKIRISIDDVGLMQIMSIDGTVSILPQTSNVIYLKVYRG